LVAEKEKKASDTGKYTAKTRTSTFSGEIATSIGKVGEGGLMLGNVYRIELARERGGKSGYKEEVRTKRSSPSEE